MYQLSRMDPRDGLRRLHSVVHNDKLAKLVGRTSTVASIVNCRLTNNGPLFVVLSVHRCRTKLTTRCDDRRAVVKFSKSECDS